MGKRSALWLLLAVILATLILPPAANAQGRPPLHWGSTGPSVTLAQRRLLAWGYYKGRVDGVYGAKMYSAVLWFQRHNGLPADGVVGPSTWAALGETGAPIGPQPGSRGVTRSGDLDLLARLVHAEARGEPYEGQVAVAAVILNRTHDARFPSTVASVVYQQDAFESVANGSIYLTPSTTAYSAARDALNGWDPTSGCVFFWNPATAVSRWVWSRPIVKTIGHHVFAR
ncbi:MAG: spore cortex-lytic enzyme [Mycobacterium leprae]